MRDKLKEFFTEFGYIEVEDHHRFSKIGKTFYINNDQIEGYYWIYPFKGFLIYIEDFYAKDEFVVDLQSKDPFFGIFSTFLLSANGESFFPYQNLSSNTIFIIKVLKSKVRFLLHKNFPFRSVGIKFDEEYLKEYFKNSFNDIPIDKVFFDTSSLIINPIKKIALEIFNCSMDDRGAKIFFEAKAKEWLSICVNAYLNKERQPEIPLADSQALENVATYINDHYALDINQNLLQKIAIMSGTKLKKLFKQHYNMSITEYIQKRRITMAETLLYTSDLEIKDIAKVVGYNSHSRFSSLFYKFKGIYPKDIKKIALKK